MKIQTSLCCGLGLGLLAGSLLQLSLGLGLRGKISIVLDGLDANTAAEVLLGCDFDQLTEVFLGLGFHDLLADLPVFDLLLGGRETIGQAMQTLLHQVVLIVDWLSKVREIKFAG
jgi:hypothetical protein